METTFNWQAVFHSEILWVEALLLISGGLLVLGGIYLLLPFLCRVKFNSTNHPTANFILRALRFPMSLSVTLFTLAQLAALFQVGEPWLTHLHRLFSSLDIIVWGQFFYRTSQFYLKRLSRINLKGSLIKPQTLPLFENTVAVVIVLFIVYLLFVAWDIDMTAWLASAGIIGIAVGFAAKDTIANLLSGVFILADAPYKIGDYIVLDSGERGMVTQIGLRSTRILTRDDLEVNVPNAIIANGKIVNESAGRHVKSRVRVPVGVAYGSDVEQVKALLLEEARSEEQVCQDPEPRVRFRTFGASSLNLELLIWIDNPEIRGRVVDILNTKIYNRFRTEGIEIPYAKQDVYIKSLPRESKRFD